VKAGPVLFLALRNILGRRSDERDLARRTLRGAVLSVAVSMVPLIVTLVVADGMIQGITSRYIELSSYHIQCVPFRGQGESSVRDALSALDGLGAPGRRPRRWGWPFRRAGAAGPWCGRWIPDS